MNENRQVINVIEFEVKRNSAIEKHFKIAANDFEVNSQGMELLSNLNNIYVGDLPEIISDSKYLYMQLQLTSHSNINKMVVSAKVSLQTL